MCSDLEFISYIQECYGFLLKINDNFSILDMINQIKKYYCTDTIRTKYIIVFLEILEELNIQIIFSRNYFKYINNTEIDLNKNYIRLYIQKKNLLCL